MCFSTWWPISRWWSVSKGLEKPGNMFEGSEHALCSSLPVHMLSFFGILVSFSINNEHNVIFVDNIHFTILNRSGLCYACCQSIQQMKSVPKSEFYSQLTWKKLWFPYFLLNVTLSEIIWMSLQPMRIIPGR